MPAEKKISFVICFENEDVEGNVSQYKTFQTSYNSSYYLIVTQVHPIRLVCCVGRVEIQIEI